MISFEAYLLKNKLPNKLKNLQPGDKIRSIRGIYTFLEWEEISGKLYCKVKEYPNAIIHPKYINKA